MVDYRYIAVRVTEDGIWISIPEFFKASADAKSYADGQNMEHEQMKDSIHESWLQRRFRNPRWMVFQIELTPVTDG